MADILTLHDIKESIQNIEDGEQKEFTVKQSRGRYKTYKGALEGAYKNIFVMNVHENGFSENLAFNYSDIISGKIKFV